MTPKIAFLFPGQGSQQVGMAKDWLAQPGASQQWLSALSGWITPLSEQPPFEEALEQGPESALKQTAYTQPAILLTSLLAWQALRQQVPELYPVAVAGHSLGEFGALVAAGVLTAEDALKLVVTRSCLMQHCPPGAMSAVLGLDAAQVEAVLTQANTTIAPGEIAVLANDNAKEQIVIAGTADTLARLEAPLKAAGAKRVIPLPVGGAFHSPLMQEAAEEFATSLATIPFQAPRCSVVSNVDGQASESASVLQDKLSRQMPSSVQWVRTLETLVQDLGIDTVIEIGPGKVLTGLIKKAHPSVQTFNIAQPADIEAVASWWLSQRTVAVTA